MSDSVRKRTLTTSSVTANEESAAGVRCEDCEAPSTDNLIKRTDSHFIAINERPVDDISIEFFYRPHTITLLLLIIGYLLYSVFTRDDSSRDQNIYAGLKAIVLFFLVVSVLAFPNGPFTRPHPAVWRIIFGLSVLYLIFLQFILCQNFMDVKALLKWFDPKLTKMHLEEKEYAVNCSDISFKRIAECVDYFVFAHFAGWMMKAVLIRHYIILWYISIIWEITELVFYHLLPNFQECWWDAIILDILLSNGLGIYCGMWICKKLEMRSFHWESIKAISTTRGKLKRAVMQFTPASWIHVRWLDPNSTLMRIFAVWQLVVVWQITELNSFFLKHIFAVETEHPLNFWRIILIGAIVAPSIRQYYTFVTDPYCKRMGTQCWVACAIVLTESLICLKFGKEIFAQAQIKLIFAWLFLMLIGSFFCVYLCIILAKRSSETEERQIDGESHHYYIDSSFENLAALSDSNVQVVRRRQPTTMPSRSVSAD